MNPKWAEENLQTIRTLMERSAIYRRALAPIMILCGVIGIFCGVAGWGLGINSTRGFVFLWIFAAALSLASSLLLARRQAIKDSEPLWSAPTKRIAQALFPPFFIGLLISVVWVSQERFELHTDNFALIIIWLLFFGFAVHSAGFFMPRGVKRFAWMFIIVGCVLLLAPELQLEALQNRSPHLLMAAIFGGLHLAYGIYLYFTEKKTPVA
jgi:hypothetical protein